MWQQKESFKIARIWILGENDSRKCCKNVACYPKMFFDNFVFAHYINFKQTMFDMGLAFVRSGFLQKRLAAN